VLQYRVAVVPEKHLVFTQEFESAKRAADTLALVAAHITAVCRGKRKTHGGFAWAYKAINSNLTQIKVIKCQ
jgi:uncharacterized protein YndB with AHSA1/START domain